MAVDPDKLREELKAMKDLIANDPIVMAQFDTDGNGVIDGNEWEAVRQLVIRRLERQEQEEAYARELYANLDPAQAAELARMEADMEEESESIEFDEREPNPMEISGQIEDGQNWDNLELAFDPHQDAAVRKHNIAQKIYDRELADRGPRVNRLSTADGTLADCNELVLEQGGGAKQFFGNMFRREYIVRDADGEEVGRIGQHENEMLQDLTNYQIFEDPDLHFSVHDHVSNETYSLRRTSGFSDNSIQVLNERGRMLARSSWTISFVRRKYEVYVSREKISYYVRRKMLQPWTYEILDHFEEPIGEMQRGWSGLGFLTMGNMFHIEVDIDVSPEAMWGFLATAVLADLDTEKGGRRKAALDLFNS